MAFQFQMNGKCHKDNISLKQSNKVKFQNINGGIKIKRIKMDILYVTIYGINVLKYQKNGRIINIRILKQNTVGVNKHKHFMMQIMEEYQIKKTIMILIYKIRME